ncbi:MAG: hypothetical protein IKL33_04525 [Alphaproteobacteria bacterium]|nr:hypothetical protein [Alphaproteobacteria bacterium]MBR6664074.1 hypothetical protein [Alphaproteobacteria bacterium]
MTYFSKNFSEEVVLPDGSIASSVADIDRFLKANDLAAASDYSAEYLQNVRMLQEKHQREEIFVDLLQQYKKRIWND